MLWGGQASCSDLAAGFIGHDQRCLPHTPSPMGNLLSALPKFKPWARLISLARRTVVGRPEWTYSPVMTAVGSLAASIIPAITAKAGQIYPVSLNVDRRVG